MQDNNFLLNLIASLNKAKSKVQINKNIKEIEPKISKIKLVGKLGLAETRREINKQLKGKAFGKIKLDTEVNSKNVNASTKKTISNAQKIANKYKVRVSYSFDMDKQKFQNQLKNFAKQNSKLFTSKEMTMKYNQLVDSASIARSKAELKGLRSQLSAFRTELIAVNKAGMTWTDKFKASISHFARYFSGASFIYAITNQLRSAWTEAKTLDDKLVDLQKVTSEIEDRNSLYKYFDKALNKANELNVKVGSLVSAITEFKKMGWSLSDAELGGEWATKLSNVGDVDIETAIGSIKTAIASFDEIGGYGNDQLDKKLEAYVDLINNMSNKYSIDAQGLAESIRLSAGTLTEANTSIEQAATMYATANKYYNDPEYLGNTAKIGSLRLRATTGDDGALEELSEMGEDIEDVTALTGKLREELLSLTGVDIMVDNNTFKSYYDQLKEISGVIDTLDDTTSAKVLETLFGKNRAAAGMSILSGLQESEKAYEDAVNSAGSSTEEYSKWLQGADAATQRFSNSLTEMYQSFINGNTVRDLANMGSAVLDFANSWGIVESTVKGFLALKIGTLITNGAMAFVSATKQVERYGNALRMANNVPNNDFLKRTNTLRDIAQATSTLTTKQLKQVLSSKQLTYQDRIRILQMQGMTKKMAAQKLAEMQLTQATKAQTSATKANVVTTFSWKSALVGLGATMKSVFLSNPIGISIMALSTIFGTISTKVSQYNEKLKETRQANIDASSTAKEHVDTLSDLYVQYQNLNGITNKTSSQEEKFKTVVQDLTKQLGAKAKVLEGLTEDTDEYTKAIKEATKAELEDQYATAKVGAKAAEDALKDATYDTWDGSQITIPLDVNMTGDKKHMAALDEVRGILSKYEDEYAEGGMKALEWEPVDWDSNNNDMNAVVEYYNALVEARTKLVTSDNADYLMGSDIYKNINNTIEKLSEGVKSYTEQQYNALKLNYEWQNGIPSTVEEFEKMKQAILDSSNAGERFKEILKGYLAEDFTTFSNSIKEKDDNTDEPKLTNVEETKALDDLNAKYQEAIDKRKELYSGSNYVGNVDINNRPVVINDDGTYSTTSTSFQERKLDDGTYEIIHFTPILPDGTVLEGDALNNYLDKILGSSNVLEADNPANGGYGLVYKVDTEINGKKITDGNLNDAFGVADAWDVEMHNIQDVMYRNEAEIKSVIEKFGEKFLSAWKSTPEDLKDNLLELAKAGKLTESAFKQTDTTSYFENLGLSAEETVEKINNLVGAEEQLKALSDDISDISNALATKKENKVVDASSLQGFNEEIRKLDAWENFAKLMGNSKSSMKDCQDAANELASEWINNNNFLSNLNDTNKQYYISQLKLMGIENAETIVAKKLNGEKEALRFKYQALNAALTDFEGKTSGATTKLFEEAEAAGASKTALANLAGQELLFNNSRLDVSQKITALNQLAYSALGISEALNDGMGLDSRLWGDVPIEERIAAKWKSILDNAPKLETPSVEISPNGTKDPKDKDKDNKKDKSKETFDWVEKRLEKLSGKTEKLKKKFEDAFSLKGIDNSFKKVMSSINKEIKANEKAADKYMKKAEKVGLSSKYKEKIKNGSMNIDEVTNEKTKEKIKKYQEYYDKSKSAEEKVKELRNEEMDLTMQYGDKKLDRFEGKSSLTQSKIDRNNSLLELYDAQGVGIDNENYRNARNTNVTLTEKEVENKKNAYDEYAKWYEENQKNLTKADKEKAKENLNNLEAEYNEAIQANIEANKAILKDDLQLAKWEQDKIGADAQKLEGNIAINEAKGIGASKKDYQDRINLSKESVVNLQNQNNLLKAQQVGLNENSQEYQDLQAEIDANNQAIQDATVSQIEWNNAIRNMDLDNLKEVGELLNSANSKYDKLNSLAELHGNNLSDDKIAKWLKGTLASVDNLEGQKAEILKDIQTNISDLGLNPEQQTQLNDLIELGDIDKIDFYLKSMGYTISQTSGLTGNLKELFSIEGAILDDVNKAEEVFDMYYNNRIDEVNEYIDAIQKEKEIKDRTLATEKARFELEKAKSNLTKKVWNGEEWVYTADQDAVQSAQENLDNNQHENLINALEDLTEALEKEKENVNLYDDNANSILTPEQAETLLAQNGYVKVADSLPTVDGGTTTFDYTKFLANLPTPSYNVSIPSYENLIPKSNSNSVNIQNLQLSLPNVTDSSKAYDLVSGMYNELLGLGVYAKQFDWNK